MSGALIQLIGVDPFSRMPKFCGECTAKNNKINILNDGIGQLNNKIGKLNNKIIELEEEIIHLKYRPGGSGYHEAKEDIVMIG